MKFCDDHWTRLREAIEQRDLGSLITRDAETAVAQMADQLRRGSDQSTVTNFDPLMSAHWNIASNVMDMLGPQGFCLLAGPDAPEDEVEFTEYPNGKAVQLRLLSEAPMAAAVTWPRCPICYISLAHELTCDGDSRCKLPMVNGYDDYCLTNGADAALAKAKELRLR